MKRPKRQQKRRIWLWIILILLGIWWGFAPKPWQTYFEEKTYYVIADNTAIYGCASETCERVGHYDSTDVIKSYHPLSEQPEWVDLSGGFIRKSDLRE